MTQKRKAELQRKLSMAPVAKPPADLADRIKAGIPDYLDARHDRERLSRSISFSLRIAASIILLVTSAFFAVEFLSRGESPASRAVEVAEPAVVSLADEDAAVETAAGASVAQETAATSVAVAADRAGEDTRAPLVAPARQVARRDRAVEQQAVAQHKVAEAAPPPPPAAPVAPPPPPAAVVAESIETTAATAPTASPVPAPAADLAVAGRVAAFAAREERAQNEVDRLSRVLKEGDTPAGVDVEAVVDHFAGPPASGLQDVQLEVEASRAPLAGDDTAIIRYTIDVPPSVSGGLPVTEARLSIVLEKGVIASYRTISGVRPPSDAKKYLQNGRSVTGLVELRLAADTPADQRVATILLDYESRATGKRVRASQPVFAGDLDRGWDAATRRHRLATLSAKWSESLRGGGRTAGVAEAAAELAQENPSDARAQELAKLTASSRLRTSSPTGSGR